MAYIKPKCDCNGELIHMKYPVYEVSTRINANGRLTKRKPKPTLSNDDDRWYPALECEKCGNLYDFSFDEKKRIIRLELFGEDNPRGHF